jgi:hypothetical protein
MKLIKLFLYLAFLFLFIQSFYTINYWQSTKQSYFSQVYTNPYSNLKNGSYKKASFHLHSDEVFFTPERHSTKDIIDTYKRYGYEILSISDYNRITIPDTLREISLPAYEWGSCLRKRHILILGIEELAPSKLFFSSFLENVQFAISFAKKRDAYVVVNHPHLYSAFSLEDLFKLYDYDAIEVLSPFGDIPETWDKLLSGGKKIHCAASDDLHYFPESITKNFNQSSFKNFIQHIFLQRNREGEALTRYLLVYTSELTKTNILNSLREGNFYCVKKFYRESPDPSIPEIHFSKNKLFIKSSQKFLKLDLIGKNGNLLYTSSEKNFIEYEVKPEDMYARVIIYSLSGIIFSNPVFFQISQQD